MLIKALHFVSIGFSRDNAEEACTVLSRGVRPRKLVADVRRYAMQLRSALCEQICGGVGISFCLGEQLAVAKLNGPDGMLRRMSWHPCQIDMVLWNVIIIQECKQQVPCSGKWPRGSRGPLLPSLEGPVDFKTIGAIRDWARCRRSCSEKCPNFSAMH